MSNNVSSNYGALFGSRVQANNAPVAPAANVPSLPLQPGDSARFSAAANAAATVSATASPDMRGELLQLRKELMDVNKQLEQMIAQVNAQQQALPAQLPAPAANPAPAVAPAAAGPYTVQAGDYLWKIAKEKLGDANRWPEIYNLNRNVIGDNPNLLQPGQVLQLPGAAPSQPATPATNQPQPNNPPAANWPQFPPANQPPVNNPQPWPNNPPQQPWPNNGQPQPWPNNGQLPPLPPPGPVVQPPFPGVNQPAQGLMDVQPSPTNRNISDQDVLNVGREFGLIQPNAPITPDARANVAAFMDELDSYEKAYRGKVFGPGMESLAANPTEVQQFHQSVQQIQQALALLIKGGKLQPKLANGQPVQDLPITGSFFKVDAQGRELRDPQGNPLMDEAFVAAITQFKQDHGIHQTYKLADGSYGINEYVGPNTVEALKQALLQMQGRQ